MEKGEVVDSAGARLLPDAPYRSGIHLYYYRELDTETRIPFDDTVLYRDEHILVVDKPHFLPVTPSGRYLQETLLVRLKRKHQLEFLVPVHRLDRETAGVVLFSIKPETRGAYHSLFQRRQVVKTYEALAGSLPGARFPMTRRSRLVEGQPFFRMCEVDGEPNAETHIDVLENRGNTALYRLRPVTGKKHQLRVHLAALGIPIANDSLYPALMHTAEDDYSRPLQLLARALAFIDPLSGIPREFESRRTLQREIVNIAE